MRTKYLSSSQITILFKIIINILIKIHDLFCQKIPHFFNHFMHFTASNLSNYSINES